MKQSRFLFLMLSTLILVSCDKDHTSFKKGDIFISDASSVFKVNPKSGETKKILEGQVADISYNKTTQSVFSVNRGEKGYTEINSKNTSTCSNGLAASNYLYAYKNHVLSDSWIIHHDANGEIMGQFGIYDVQKKKLMKTFKAYGTFDAITGYKNTAYVTMFGSMKKNSNVYEVNMDTSSIRPVFRTSQARAPKVLFSANGHSYGFYKHWDTGPANELVSIDLKTGKTKAIAKLSAYAYNMQICGELAIVVHFDEMNEHITIPDCVTIVNLKTGQQTKMSIPDIRPTNIIGYDEKTVAITDECGYLLLLNPFEEKIVKKHFIHEGLYFLASAT